MIVEAKHEGTNLCGKAERCKAFPLNELIQRHRVNLDIFGLTHEGLKDFENLPDVGILASDVAVNHESVMEQFSGIHDDL